MSAPDHVEAVFPELANIADEELRTGVRDAWVLAMREAGVSDLTTVPWLPPRQTRLDLPDETLADHVRDVTHLSVALAETLQERRDVECPLDTVVAGALVHDVSKLVEFDGMDETETYELLGHPYYGVHLTAQAGLPVELQHVVLSHSPRTAVAPATLPAFVVAHADDVATASIHSRAVEDLREV